MSENLERSEAKHSRLADWMEPAFDLAMAAEGLRDGLALTDKNGAFIFMNRSHREMFGYESPEEILGRSWKMLYEPEVAAWIEGAAFPALAETGEWRGEVIGITRNGERVHQEVSLTAFASGIICMTRDVRARAEEQRQRELLSVLSREIEQRQQVGAIAHQIAHDLGNLTASLNFNLHILDVEPADLQPMRLALDRMSELVRRLGRLDERLRPEQEPWELVSAIRATWEIAAAFVPPGRGELAVEALAARTSIHQGLFNQTLLNLIKNGAEALGDKGRLTVRVHAHPSTPPPGAALVSFGAPVEGASLWIEVADGGVGMSPDLLEKVSTPYFSTKATPAELRRGLGFASLMTLVELSGVHVRIISQQGSGTTVQLQAPLEV